MPRFGAIQPVTAISMLRANAEWHGWDAGEDTQVAPYNPPAGWVVLDTQTIVHSSSNGARSVSVLAGGLNLVTESTIENVYKSAINASGRYSDKSISGKLRAEKEKRISELRRFQSSHNTIYAVARAKAHGSFVDRKRGWEEFSVLARIMYIGAPNTSDLKTELEAAYKININVITKESSEAMQQAIGSSSAESLVDLPEESFAESAEIAKELEEFYQRTTSAASEGA